MAWWFDVNARAALAAAGFVVDSLNCLETAVVVAANLPAAPTSAQITQVQTIIAAQTGPTVDQQAEMDVNANWVAIRTKAKAVWAGTDTFTATQIQRLLAALVLHMTKGQG